MRLIILLVAAGAAIAAVFLVRSAQAPRPAAAAVSVQAPKPKEVPLKQILVAKQPILVGKFVVADDLKWQDWPEDGAVGASFIDKKTEPEALEKMVGAVARFELVEGEPVTKNKLVHPGEQGFMAVMLTPGMRAVSIEISAETAAGGFIQPNDRIDVVVTREVAGNANAMQNVRSDMILQNIRVLAIDGIYGPPPKEGMAAVLMGTRATLELSQQDAGLLATAKKAGEVTLSLRSIADMQSPSGATMTGRVYRDGMAQGAGADGVRVYRYGTETVSKAPAG